MRFVPPPLWALLALAATYALSLGLGALPLMPTRPLGLIVAAAALFLLFAAMSQFMFAGTQLLPASEKNNELVTGGVFAFTRNPMYLAMVLFCAGGALWFERIPMLLAPIIMFAIANWVFIPFEEAKMRRQFPDSFDAYAKRVRRWL
jgi:protein-S-isoprenylcysteine O-methyltransferase Ste14